MIDQQGFHHNKDCFGQVFLRAINNGTASFKFSLHNVYLFTFLLFLNFKNFGLELILTLFSLDSFGHFVLHFFLFRF